MQPDRVTTRALVGQDNPAPSGAQAPDCLNSWKEIATHLRHSVRTVQRWERIEGLPVHRHGHEKRDAVYAYRDELDAWWRRRVSLGGLTEPEAAGNPSPDGGPDAPRPTASRWTWLLVAGTLVSVVGSSIAWIATLSRGPDVPFAPRDYVLVADLENLTGDPAFDRSLWTAFTVGLQQSTHANVVPRSRMEAALRRMGQGPETRIGESLGREVCQREHVKLLVVPSLTAVGGEFAISVRLVAAESGETLRAYQERTASQDGILGSLGTIARKLRGDLGESLAAVRRTDRPLPRVTTPSLQALRSYADGEHLWSRREHQAALRCFEAALGLDPDFAMADAALAGAYLSHIYFEPEKAKQHYDRALAAADRITDRERLLIQASYHGSLNHVDEARVHYRQYLSAYPDDLTARQAFGNLLMRNDRAAEAVEQFQAIVLAAPTDAGAFLGLAGCLRLLGRAEEALARYDDAFRLEPGWRTNGNLNHEYGFGWVQAANPARAREVFLSALDKPGMRPRALRSLAMLNLYTGKYRAAAEQLQEAIRINQVGKEPLVEARNHLYMAILLDGRGETAGGVRELERALRAMGPSDGMPVWLQSRVALRFARTGSAGRAEALRRLLAARVDQASAKDRGDLSMLDGALAQARGEHELAVTLFQKAHAEAPSPLTLSALADALRLAGRMEPAIASYEKLIAEGHLALGWEPQQDWIVAHLTLAEIYLTRSRETEARQLVDRLARIWSEADPDVPLTRRLARLRERLRVRG
jgi:tetratricopeptide (TPR) repeat protein